MMKNKYEILSPAGSFDALVAGINAGANAIYLGGDKFGARVKAANFSNEELIKAVEYAHLRNVKIYVTVNILISDEEMRNAIEFAGFLNKIGIDGIIVQDLGFSGMVRKLFPQMEVHASTQMAINNYYGAAFVERLGFERVVLARETELCEVEKIKKNTKLDIEGFVHGALCVAFSGECLMSSMIGGRSGNRGDCAQPCRRKYEILDLNKNKIEDAAYYLSTKDLNTIGNVKELVERGVYSLKIEGRMKKPEYVYQIVSGYKKALIDSINEEDKKNMEQIFNRGFTKGLFNGDFGRSFSSFDRPDNRGVLAGEITDFRNGRYTMRFFEDINENDGVEFAGANGSFGMKADFSVKRGQEIKYRLRKRLEIPGKIYRTSSERLNKELKENIEKEYKFRNISFYGEFFKGKNPTLRVKSGDIDFTVEEDQKIDAAKNKPTDEDRIIKNLSKLGGTIYELEEINIKLDEDIFMPVSVLNNLRRLATDRLDRILTENDRKKVEIPESIFKIARKDVNTDTGIDAEVYNFSALKAATVNKDLNILMDIRNIDNKIIDYLKAENLKISVVMPKFQNSAELEVSGAKINNFISNIDSIYCNNIAHIEFFKDLKIKKVADIGLNVFNSYTARFLYDMGFEKVYLSPELSRNEIKKIAKKAGGNIGVISHGLLPVMTLKHCPMSVVKNCKSSDNCDRCKFSKGFYLRDIKDADFLVERREGVSELYNSHPIVLMDKISEMSENGVRSFRLYIREDIEETVNNYYKAFNGKDYNDSKMRDGLMDRYGNITYGHYNRGVLK